MLLVDHDQAKAVELNFLFNQGVSADDELRSAAVDEAAVCALAVFVERAGEQDDARLAARFFKQFAGGEIVLRGQDFSGRH